MSLKSESYTKGAVYSSTLGAVAKLVAFAQNLSIAYFIGANVHTDIYFYLFQFSLLLSNMGQTITTSVLIPRFTQMRIQQNEKKSMAYINSFIVCVAAIGVVIIIIAWLFGPFLLKAISGFSAESIKENVLQVYLFAPVIVLYLLNMLYAEVLVSYKYFTLPTVLNLINNCFIILFIIIFNQSLDILSAVVGLGAAALINFVGVVVLLRKNLHWNFLLIKFSLLKDSYRDIFTIFGNQVVVVVVSIFPFYILSWLHPSVVTIANYAIKLAQTPVNILIHIFAVLQIKLNELAVSEAYEQMKKIYLRVTSGAVLLSILLVVVLYILRSFLIDFLYGIGGMEGEALSSLKEVFGILIFSIPLTIIGVPSTKLFIATQEVKFYTILMFVVSIMGVGIYSYLIPRIGVNGYAYAFVAYEGLLAILFSFFGYGILRRRSKKLHTQ
ncbi:hypothetical protein D0T50_07840 [Bacteroides sp. 214]|uniref:lipid II flippase MurJ n=1 Tax=Bacteroides sp. 214 TaxID=2302935 RepID=UPI0013D040CE|nr:lipid II flippase MurJ [Bacteroides sp. 214]NDW12800.1 hypothetical protein [Bacteroides sp. 214]